MADQVHRLIFRHIFDGLFRVVVDLDCYTGLYAAFQGRVIVLNAAVHNGHPYALAGASAPGPVSGYAAERDR